MGRFRPHSTAPVKERAILVGVDQGRGAWSIEESLEELDQALDKALAFNGPTLIECPINKDEFVTPMLPVGGTMEDLVVNMDDVDRLLGNRQ